MRNTARTLRQLLSPARIATAHFADTTLLDGQHRSAFETDGDKISFTEGFRALADKTQVHDRVTRNGNHRNRLTHSQEVSRVGRSLGVAVGARMIGYYGLHAPPAGEAFWRLDPSDIGHTVAAACLAHDIGNPPFGHDGEDAVSAFFRDTGPGQRAVALAGPEVGAELAAHEGNAQGFRMITRASGWRQEGGLNLAAATLAAFSKYPYRLEASAAGASRKYGVHARDMESMRFVAEATGMLAAPRGWWRHPLAWLMEAADDICYLTVDLEDAAWIGILDLEELCDLYAPIIGEAEIARGRRMADAPRMIQYLRSRMIKTLIDGCVEVYPDLADAIDDSSLAPGPHGGGLIDHSRHSAPMAAIRRASRERIYTRSDTQSARDSFRDTLMRVLGQLTEELLAAGARGDASLRDPTGGAGRYPALARLPHANLDPRLPEDPAEAFPWLLDQLTLMSDAQVLDLRATLAL